MAWSWSHTDEAYENARLELDQKSTKWLMEVYVEWKCHYVDEYGNPEMDITPEMVAKAEDEAKSLPISAIIDFIWERMSENATCDNGGFNAWACPFGCHTVSFGGDE